MQLITNDYCAEMRRMHEEKIFGKSGGKWWRDVNALIAANKVDTWLDYGCGRGKLRRNVTKRPARANVQCTEYDPGVAGKDGHPVGKFDLVTCLDVLEHIEPECLHGVLRDLHDLTGKLLFVVISTRFAGKVLSDGRNAHLIVCSTHWWRWTLNFWFEITRDHDGHKDELCVELRPRRDVPR